ncbi:hypothetical protein I302_102318 [Kwoniella bestiolae CBS 10118]|uniref:AB hydrolase-1 domain-containing protein n=1 Tax=Kwoniella bestiolae CBS 10118 TaxID=1296100 RepID=A0A1B9GEL7_9TREE|nr:hypothetical protein I302_01010 [Kwoniella bestiolae CBS 10118]OCF29503.1 hypothetical protein I302_01010 [Kwoniella bestiolae CBS 10118]
MPRLIIPNTPFDLFYRLSTPSKRDKASEIDKKYETILLFHPFWVDSFYFYPQFDDPALYENYNLLAFDAPAHGSTKVKGISPDPVTWAFFAGIVKEALTMLDITSVHLVGSTMGSCPAMHFASRYPEMSRTLVMIGPPAPAEATNWSLTFRESMHILINAVKAKDPEPLDAITSVIFDYNATSHCKRLMKDLEEEYIQLTRSRLLSGELNSDITVPVIISIALSRKQLLTLEEAVNLRPPVLIIQGSHEGWEEHDDQWKVMLEETHLAYAERNQGRICDSRIKVLAHLPRWMSLTSPDIVNPVIKQFISQPRPVNPDHDTSPIPDEGHVGGDGRARRRSSIKKPLSPRDTLEFGVQPQPPQGIVPKGKSIGEVLDARHGNDDGDPIQDEQRRRSEGVNVQVEVVMKVD